MLHVGGGKPTEFGHAETSAKGKMQSWSVQLAEGFSAIAVAPVFYTLI